MPWYLQWDPTDTKTACTWYYRFTPLPEGRQSFPLGWVCACRWMDGSCSSLSFGFTCLLKQGENGGSLLCCGRGSCSSRNLWCCMQPVRCVCLGFVSGVSHTQHLSVMGFVVVFFTFNAETPALSSFHFLLPSHLPLSVCPAVWYLRGIAVQWEAVGTERRAKEGHFG